jgi:hypothetical protein
MAIVGISSNPLDDQRIGLARPIANHALIFIEGRQFALCARKRA